MKWSIRAAMLGAVMLAGCKVTSDYQRPVVQTPTTFKSATTQEAPPSRLGRNWWRLFNEPELETLCQRALAGNQDVRAAVARVAQARAGTQVTASQFYPVVTLDPSAGVSKGMGTARTIMTAGIPFDLSYEIDIWGRVRRSVEAAQAAEAATADQLAVIQLTLLADLAQNYFTLRSLDTQIQIVARNLDLYRQQLALVERKLKAELVSRVDVAQARVQVEATQTQLLELQRQRADIEHAIAALLGMAPAELTIKPRPLDISPPRVPAGLPAELLGRRPDVATAERALASAAASVGVAQANFYPVVRLTGAAGYESISTRNVLNWQNFVWSLGPSVSIPIFEGGRLEGQLAQTKARYDELLANYRQSVLVAFREVEDALTDLHSRADQAASQDKAVAAARDYLSLVQVQYERGLINYLQVLDADRVLLSNELTAAQIRNQRLVASVLLIKALGGGWEAPGTPASTQTAAPAAR